MLRRITNSQVATVRKALLVRQKGRCAICSENLMLGTKLPALDHDHDTGVIRGVLCANCNGIEGKVRNLANRAKRDGTVREWVAALQAYWEFHAEDRTGMLHPTHKSDAEKAVLKAKKAKAYRVKAKARKVANE